MIYLGIILGVVVLWLIAVYNSFVKKKMRVKEAWADIEVQLKRRYNLIPNLVETVKGYAAHEKETLTKVIEARTKAMSASGGKEKIAAENYLSQTLKTLFAVAENYPQLKANQNFLELQKELIDTEDKIQAARRFYNANVRDYNIALKVFPKNIIAAVFHFTPEPLFEITTEEERKTPKVSFGS
ncbi:LemA family protein [bacterium]|nr:LemA family protein [bacterium]